LILFFVLSGLFIALLIVTYIGLSKLKNVNNNFLLSVSIIIAARNEEDRILPCLQSLEKLNYPQEKFEIIFVDDCSNDNTPTIIEKHCKNHNNWKLIRIYKKSDEIKGKKNALLNGINQSKGEIIFTTDADCIVPENWIKEMINYFEPNVSMVIGHSPITRKKGLYQKILQFDNLFSAVAASAPTKLGNPISSIGRNLAYRKSAYEDVGSFLALKQYRSGDDILLTERFHYLNDGKIDFCAHPETYVKTHPPEKFADIFHQQVRKNSKALLKSPSSILFSAILFLYYLFFLSFPFLFPKYLIVWLIIFVTKFIIEFVDLAKAAKIFNLSHTIKYIPIMQIIYPFHIMLFSVIGIFQLYQWKK
jgi:cellulose synthase/poly-beta-1,6-N-acetylglucosamine synthase-like glycosyltransferase